MERRWKLRFGNYGYALSNLAGAVGEFRARPLSLLEQAGLIQLFEITWDTGWKVLRDYLRESGFSHHETASPVTTIRSAYAANVIEDGQTWMDATKLRHTLSHEYHPDRAAEGLDLIVDKFLPMFQRLKQRLADEV